MTNHSFKGNGLFCLVCFKGPDSHASHQASPDISPEIKSPEISEQIKLTSCKGHKCSKCKNIWLHDYDCDNHDMETICSKCISDSAVEINREDDILFITQLQVITPLDAKKLELSYDTFIDNNIFKNADGSENPNWREAWEKNYTDLEKIIENCRIKQSSMQKNKAKKNQEEILTFTPEEREEFEKLAKQRKKVSKKETKEKIDSSKEDSKKKYEAGLKSIISTLMKLGISESAAKKQAMSALGADDNDAKNMVQKIK